MNRRSFLGWVSTGAAGLLLPTLVKPKLRIFDMGRARHTDIWMSPPGFIEIYDGPMPHLNAPAVGTKLVELKLRTEEARQGILPYFGMGIAQASGLPRYFRVVRRCMGGKEVIAQGTAGVNFGTVRFNQMMVAGGTVSITGDFH